MRGRGGATAIGHAAWRIERRPRLEGTRPPTQLAGPCGDGLGGAMQASVEFRGPRSGADGGGGEAPRFDSECESGLWGSGSGGVRVVTRGRRRASSSPSMDDDGRRSSAVEASEQAEAVLATGCQGHGVGQGTPPRCRWPHAGGRHGARSNSARGHALVFSFKLCVRLPPPPPCGELPHGLCLPASRDLASQQHSPSSRQAPLAVCPPPPVLPLHRHPFPLPPYPAPSPGRRAWVCVCRLASRRLSSSMRMAPTCPRAIKQRRQCVLSLRRKTEPSA